jgi:hypothetical protein
MFQLNMASNSLFFLLTFIGILTGSLVYSKELEEPLKNNTDKAAGRKLN